jgi:hypothetical protein
MRIDPKRRLRHVVKLLRKEIVVPGGLGGDQEPLLIQVHINGIASQWTDDRLEMVSMPSVHD